MKIICNLTSHVFAFVIGKRPYFIPMGATYVGSEQMPPDWFELIKSEPGFDERIKSRAIVVVESKQEIPWDDMPLSIQQSHAEAMREYQAERQSREADAQLKKVDEQINAHLNPKTMPLHKLRKKK